MDPTPEEAGDEEDPWPDEPDEPDPDSLGPEAPEAPEPPSVDLEDVDAPDDLQRTFWATVVLVNVGLLAVSLAAMFAFFQGRYLLSGGLAVLGVGALAHAYREYRGYVEGES